MHTQRATVAALGLLVLTACGTRTGPGEGPADPAVPVTGVTWAVESLTHDGRRSEPQGPRADDVRVEFDGKGHAEGSYGCNGFRADAEIEGDVITVGRTVSTEKGCEPKTQAFEDRMREAFAGRFEAKAEDGRLTLTAEDGDVLTLVERPGEEPSAAPALLGTGWKVRSLTEGDAVSSLPEGTETPVLTFRKGRVEAELGCNSGSASARTENPDAAAGEITFGPLQSTQKHCGDAMTTEFALREALSGTAAYRIADGTLTVTGPGGKGFVAVPA